MSVCSGHVEWIAQDGPVFHKEIAIVPPTTPATPRWAPAVPAQRVRYLCHRFALSEPAARLLAPLVFGEGQQ